MRSQEAIGLASWFSRSLGPHGLPAQRCVGVGDADRASGGEALGLASLLRDGHRGKECALLSSPCVASVSGFANWETRTGRGSGGSAHSCHRTPRRRPRPQGPGPGCPLTR